MARWNVRGSKATNIASRITNVAAATLIQYAQLDLPGGVLILGVPSTVPRLALEQIDRIEPSVSVALKTLRPPMSLPLSSILSCVILVCVIEID